MEILAQVSRAATRFLSGTAFSRATGFVRDLTMAAAFGAQPAVAAFLIAFRFANLPRRLLGEGAMHSAFVPRFEALRSEDPARAAAFFRDLTVTLLTVICLLVLFAEGGLRTWLGHGDLSQGTFAILRLTMMLLPALGFICLYGLNQARLNCEGIYFLPGIAPAFFNLVWIGLTLSLWHLPAADAMPILAGGLVAGYGLQWAVTLPPILRRARQYPARARLFSREVRRFLRPWLLGIAGVAASQVNSALDPIFARLADSSGPAYLWYAIRLQQLPLALFGIGLYSALLPSLSRLRGTEDYPRLLSFAYRRALFIMIPTTLAILLFGRQAIELIYQHGRFSATDTLLTARCLAGYALGLIPMTLVLIRAGHYYAHNRYGWPAIASALAVAANIALNSLFILVWHWGPASVALATSLSACLQLALLYRPVTP